VGSGEKKEKNFDMSPKRENDPQKELSIWGRGIMSVQWLWGRKTTLQKKDDVSEAKKLEGQWIFSKPTFTAKNFFKAETDRSQYEKKPKGG